MYPLTKILRQSIKVDKLGRTTNSDIANLVGRPNFSSSGLPPTSSDCFWFVSDSVFSVFVKLMFSEYTQYTETAMLSNLAAGSGLPLHLINDQTESYS